MLKYFKRTLTNRRIRKSIVRVIVVRIFEFKCQNEHIYIYI